MLVGVDPSAHCHTIAAFYLAYLLVSFVSLLGCAAREGIDRSESELLVRHGAA